MKKVEYEINVDGIEFKSLVFETNKQKDILDVLDEMLENAEMFGWEYTFEDDSFYVEYTDGATYEVNACGEYGTYKKRNIKKIIYVNANDTIVYGEYTINEYGNVA